MPSNLPNKSKQKHRKGLRHTTETSIFASRPHTLSSGRRYSLVPLLARAKGVGELLERRAQELGLGPEVGGKEAVGAGDGDEGGLESVLEGLGGAGGGGVGVFDTGELEEALDGGGGNEAGTTGSRDEL
jgi:hypothetical protein